MPERSKSTKPAARRSSGASLPSKELQAAVREFRQQYEAAFPGVLDAMS